MRIRNTHVAGLVAGVRQLCSLSLSCQPVTCQAVSSAVRLAVACTDSVGPLRALARDGRSDARRVYNYKDNTAAFVL